jgi:hypothetical protein
MGYQLIETVTVGSGGAASIEFTSIPQDGVDLLLLVSARTSSASIKWSAAFFINGSDAGSIISLIGNGSSVTSSSVSQMLTVLNGGNTTANTFNNASVYISNYTSSLAKSISSDHAIENNATDSDQSLFAMSSTNTSPVSSLGIITGTTIVEHSTASLYKITAD